jgi:hypothetical protein
MSFESAEERRSSRFGLSRLAAGLLDRFWLKDGPERATFYFALKTLARSAKQRLYFVGFVSVGVAVVVTGILELMIHASRGDLSAAISRPGEALLSIPLVISFFTLVGTRAAFELPAELPANWIFQITEDRDGRSCLSGARKVMIAVAVVPLFALALIAYALLWGIVAALLTVIFGVLLSLILTELLLYSFRKVPFTCSHIPGKANLPLLGGLYWLVFAVYAYSMASLEKWMFHEPVAWIVVVGAEAVILNRMMVHRRRSLTHGTGLQYEDNPWPAVQTLDLNT